MQGDLEKEVISMAKGNGIPMRIDIDMKELIRNFANENDLSDRQASKKMAKIWKPRMKDFKFNGDITF